MPPILQDPSLLITSHGVTIDGLNSQASRKLVEAEEYLNSASSFETALSNIDNFEGMRNLMQTEETFAALVSSAGMSEKAKGHLTGAKLEAAILNALVEVDHVDGVIEYSFRKKLVDRFLLTKGDSL